MTFPSCVHFVHFLQRTNQLHGAGSVVLEKIIVAQLLKKLLACIGPEDSSPCSQKPIIGFYPELVKSSPRLHTLFLRDTF